MRLKVFTYSGAIYTVTDQRLVQGGSKKLEFGILINAPVRIGKSMVVYAPERVELRNMPPPAPGTWPAVQSSDVVTMLEIPDPILGRIWRRVVQDVRLYFEPLKALYERIVTWLRTG